MNRAWLYLTIAVGLAVVILAVERPWTLPKSAGIRQLFAAFDPNHVARIEIERLLDGVELVRDGAEWKVRPLATALRKELPKEADPTGGTTLLCADAAPDGACPFSIANGEKVIEALHALQQMATTSLVSENPERQSLYQVDKIGLQIRAFDRDGQLLAQAYVGKQGPDFFSTYVRREGEEQVYLTRESLQGRFPVQSEYWRSKEIAWPPWLPKTG